MEHGSNHVWVYSDCSDEEYVSETELEEGMWLSDNESDDESTAEALFGAAHCLKEDLDTPLPLNSQLNHEEEATLKDVSGDAFPVISVEAKTEPLSNCAKMETCQPAPPTTLKPHEKKSSPRALPTKGILKNRLNSHRLKRVKQTRLKWTGASTSECHGGQAGHNRGKVVRRSDTNILAVKFNRLVEPSDVHTGDPVACGNDGCSAILSHLSSITDQQDKQEKVWVCEFCGQHNEVDIVHEEIPSMADTTFLLYPAPLVEEGGVAGLGESLVVFCIDVSGSMCVTTEVPGKFELKGQDRVKELSSLNVEGENQYLPHQQRNVTYVSRLQSVQAAVDYQLTRLARSNPSHRVALVTFGDEVNVIGDGCGPVVTLAGDKLWNSEAIVKVGGEVALPAAVSITNKDLSKKVFELEETGQTALGPALLVSLSMASRVPGSKVIICTDGLANKGIGSLDGLTTAEDKAAAQTFYEDMGILALEKNITVSLVRIKGTDCKALELGQVSDKTGGQVTTVDPLNIAKEFSSILLTPVIATNVKTRIVLHRKLYFRTEDSHESALIIPVGNVTTETELTYEYGVRTNQSQCTAEADGPSPSESSDYKVPPLMVDGKPHLPFQLQIEYVGPDGSCCLRLITEAKPVTKDREKAERDIDMGVIGTHMAHKTAQLAMEGEYTNARLSALSNQRLLQRTSHTSVSNRVYYNNIMEDIIPLENVLKTKQQTERSTFGRSHSDEEGEVDELRSDFMMTALASPQPSSRYSSASAVTSSQRKAAPKKKKAISRRSEISDDLATYCYNMKKQNY